MHLCCMICFIFAETKEFVEKLFVVLANGSYISPDTRPPKPAAAPPPPTQVINKEPQSPPPSLPHREVEKKDAADSDHPLARSNVS